MQQNTATYNSLIKARPEKCKADNPPFKEAKQVNLIVTFEPKTGDIALIFLDLGLGYVWMFPGKR